MREQQVFWSRGIRNFLAVEPLSLIPERDRDLSVRVAAAVDVDALVKARRTPSLVLLKPIQLEGNAVIVAGQRSFDSVAHQVGATEFDGRIGCTCLAVNSRH